MQSLKSSPLNQILNAIKLLRFPFSVFLLPISLFSLFYIQPEISVSSVLVMAIWHFLVFPSSNGFNSYHDQDSGPIGGLEFPPKPTKLLLHIALCFDIAAILLSLLINYQFAFFVAAYILASRLYSDRMIRLKRFPITGFLIVFLFQGAWVFCANFFALNQASQLSNHTVIASAIASSFFIGTIYPLTQIYQHQADREDGVLTLSMLLGRKSTFIFSGIMFLLSTLFLYLAFSNAFVIHYFYMFLLIMLPATLYFLLWSVRSFKNQSNITFKNTMIMLVLSSLLNNLYFLLLLNS